MWRGGGASRYVTVLSLGIWMSGLGLGWSSQSAHASRAGWQTAGGGQGEAVSVCMYGVLGMAVCRAGARQRLSGFRRFRMLERWVMGDGRWAMDDCECVLDVAEQRDDQSEREPRCALRRRRQAAVGRYSGIPVVSTSRRTPASTPASTAQLSDDSLSLRRPCGKARTRIEMKPQGSAGHRVFQTENRPS
ncbi:hypothetical protein F4802DRAFT_17839 [Xylaria palmicola]|nr:hypothetical protein F4802DRAFT_17839 [Xylaria palmicola]